MQGVTFRAKGLGFSIAIRAAMPKCFWVDGSGIQGLQGFGVQGLRV